jgi:hypothetical protein
MGGPVCPPCRGVCSASVFFAEQDCVQGCVFGLWGGGGGGGYYLVGAVTLILSHTMFVCVSEWLPMSLVCQGSVPSDCSSHAARCWWIGSSLRLQVEATSGLGSSKLRSRPGSYKSCQVSRMHVLGVCVDGCLYGSFAVSQ